MLAVFEKWLTKKRVCPWWLCYTFDNPLRRFFHDPMDILRPYVREGWTVLDIGAGMGYFSIPLAQLVGPTGRVIATDIQPQMLSTLAARARKKGVSEIINLHLAKPDSLGLDGEADFALAFWMVHETPDEQRLIAEICRLLKPNGQFLLIEPKIHVTRENFNRMMHMATELGFRLKEYPPIRLSQSALFTRGEKSSTQ